MPWSNNSSEPDRKGGRLAGLLTFRRRPARPGETPRDIRFGLPLLLVGCALLSAAPLLHQPDRILTEPLAATPHWSEEPIQPILTLPLGDPKRVALGRDLFNDGRLSGSGKLPCAACHDVAANGSLPGRGSMSLDNPTVFNTGLSFRLGWQGRDKSLEDQALATLKAPAIAHGVPLERMIARLRKDTELMGRARAIYGRELDQVAVIDAIATYERSLVTPGSRFDRWLTGDRSALSAQELRGYARFKQLGCISCHQGRNVGGNLLQRHGIFRPLASPNPRVLRVPSLRNVGVTPPYFHDGSAPTLEIAVTRMAASQLDVDLGAQDAGDIAAFLRSLTGTYQGRPLRRTRQ